MSESLRLIFGGDGFATIRMVNGENRFRMVTIDEWNRTLDKVIEQNLIYDNESTENRMLIYATEDGLRLLGEADTWFMDGTHSTAPSQFQQVFCIRTALGESYQSVAYALLSGKTQQTYEECLTAILDACLHRDIRPSPSKIVADYELAIHNAVKTAVSSNIDIQGCFYHLTQSTWRRVQADGLQSLYRNDEEVRHFCGMLDGLAFLPVCDVKEGLRVLREVAPDHLMSLVEYFDTNYVNGAFRNTNIKGLLITGEGRYFSNGIDLQWATVQKGDVSRTYLSNLEGLLRRVLVFPIPTVAIINGHAFGGGAFLALACDFRIMRPDKGWLNWPETAIGFRFGDPLLKLARTKIPPGVVQREALLFAKRLTGDQAKRLGLVDDVVEEAKMTDSAKKLVKEALGRNGLGREIFHNMKKDIYGKEIDMSKL